MKGTSPITGKGKIVLVGAVHTLLFVLLYCGRAKGFSPVLSSDFLVFAMPAILALGGYLYFAWPHAPSKCGLAARMAMTLIVSISATVVSALCGTTVAFNIWGS
jgi:hypothetical protein